MEEAITKVVNKFKSTENCLDEVEKQFDKTFENYLSHTSQPSTSSVMSSNGDGDASNSLLQEFQAIKSEFQTIQQEALELSQLQREALLAFQSSILQTVKSAQALTDPSQDGNEAARQLAEELKQQSDFVEKMTKQL